MPPSAEPLLDAASVSSTARSGVELDWLTQQGRCVRGSVSRRAMRASGDSPSHLSAKHHLLVPYLRLMVSFRGMLLTLQSGLERLTPQAHRVPVYPTVFPHSDMSLHGARSGRWKRSAAHPGSAQIRAVRPRKHARLLLIFFAFVARLSRDDRVISSSPEAGQATPGPPDTAPRGTHTGAGWRHGCLGKSARAGSW